MITIAGHQYPLSQFDPYRSRQALRAYLESPVIPGVGPGTSNRYAQRIEAARRQRASATRQAFWAALVAFVQTFGFWTRNAGAPAAPAHSAIGQRAVAWIRRNRQWILMGLIVAFLVVLFAGSLWATVSGIFGSGEVQMTAEPTAAVVFNPLPSNPPVSVTEPVTATIAAPVEQVGAGTVENVYLRVETQQYAGKDRWTPMEGVWIYLSPYKNGDVAPDINREGTLRRETKLEKTVDGIKVALTAFETPIGGYWVWVDEAALPKGCAVWLPRLQDDETSEIYPGPAKVQGLVQYEGYNAFVVKFQIVCGKEAEVLKVAPTKKSVTTPVVKTPGPTDEPTQPPPTETEPPPTETEPPPPTETEPPPPTKTEPPPTDVPPCVDCEPPSTPVPTPKDQPLPTPIFP